jgi:hypothetical protein
VSGPSRSMRSQTDQRHVRAPSGASTAADAAADPGAGGGAKVVPGARRSAVVLHATGSESVKSESGRSRGTSRSGETKRNA